MGGYDEAESNGLLARLERRDRRREQRIIAQTIDPEGFAAAARANYLRRRDQILAQRRAFRAQQRQECPWVALIDGARTRARRKGLAFNLTNRWAQLRWTGRCEWTGIPFDLCPGASRLLAPSIDRLVPRRGYVKDNCRIILFAVNSLRWGGTDADAVRIALAIVVQGLGQSSDLNALMRLLVPPVGKAAGQATGGPRAAKAVRFDSPDDAQISPKLH